MPLPPTLRRALVASCLAMCSTAPAKAADAPELVPPIAPGPFSAQWDTLRNYRCPEWFRDAKFGIWAHWGPQAVPEHGDWFARLMYLQGEDDYAYHLEHFGHPSQHGYREIPPLWRAEHFDPDRLMARYKAAGARYFVSMGVHHDNFDLWDSKYQPRWNAVAMGPKRDIVGLWKAAAAREGLRFGVSEHLGASFSWYATAHGSDQTGPLAGVPYDGADPAYRDLYHDDGGAASRTSGKWGVRPWYTEDRQWHQDWFNRISDLVDRYHPDLLYSDGGIPFGVVGRALVADFYNTNIAAHGGRLEAVYNLKDMQTGEFDAGVGVPDVERGGMDRIQPFVWQTDTSNGDWFYRRDDHYKTPDQVLKMLADIVSKNGNLLLNVVLKADGTPPPESDELLDELAAWMAINGEAIHDTRPWVVYGFGPTKMEGGHFKENYAFGEDDVRFTRSKDGTKLYALCLGLPTKPVRIVPLGTHAGAQDFAVHAVRYLGETEPARWSRQADALVVEPLPAYRSRHVVVLRIE